MFKKEQEFRRINFFRGFLTTEHDWNAAEAYHVEKRKLHSSMMHGPGVIPNALEGFRVQARGKGEMAVEVTPGYAVDGEGNDILIYERHLSQTVAFVDRHPDQLFVLDHIAKPRIEENVIEPWRSRMRELAEREHVYCKLSGVTEEADWQNWTDDQIRPYLETALEAFGPRRLMFGSNWPVCLVACDYGRWVKTVERFTGDLSTDEQAWVWGRTAVKAYGLKGPTT